MVIQGDCLEKLKTLADNSVDAVVTDPPYGWRFMGKAWDGADIEKQIQANLKRPTIDLTIKGNKAFELWTHEWAKEVFRVLKPGGHMLVFCGPRTYHRMASGVEDAGFEIRDMLSWVFGSGFPKSHNVGKATNDPKWNGWGTALKPAHEGIVLARKPLSEKTVALNVLKWGTGGLNIDGSRIGTSITDPNIRVTQTKGRGYQSEYVGGKVETIDTSPHGPPTQGRFPANILLDEEAAEMLDEQSGELKGPWGKESDKGSNAFFGKAKCSSIGKNYAGQSGGASRFFYVAKASKRERNAGLEGMPDVDSKTMMRGTSGSGKKNFDGGFQDHITKNNHPTVKPIKLMQYLIRLITQPGGCVLDPFMDSGSTGAAAKSLGFEFIGIELNEEYVEIAERRIAHGG